MKNKGGNFTHLTFRGKPIISDDDPEVEAKRTRFPKQLTLNTSDKELKKEIKKRVRAAKNYYWAKGYKYVDVPVYRFSFKFLWWYFNWFKIGYKKKRHGIMITKQSYWDLYEKLLRPSKRRSPLMCYDCLPAQPLRKHLTYRGILFHSRTDCPPEKVFLMKNL